MQPLKKIEKIQENKNPSFSEDLDRLPQYTMPPITHPSGDYTFQA
jgi:hypothetical protein